MRIDAHQHFWHFDPVRDAWIDAATMKVLRGDFLPADLEPLLSSHQFDGCVAVQADQSETETQFLLGLAAENPFIKAVVGWTDLRSPDLKSRLEAYSQHPRLKGFRHILQGEEPAYMLQPEFVKGLCMLGEHGFTYDILVFPNHLYAVKQLLAKLPNQPLVIDHLAKPYVRAGKIREWQADMSMLAQYQNVYCKLSGLVTEADWNDWKPADLFPYLDVALDCFGPDRLMYGSDWPVCLLAATYARQLAVLEEWVSKQHAGLGEKVFGINATRFYGIQH